MKKQGKHMTIARKDLQKRNKGKCVQIDELEDMHLKN